MLLRYIPAAFLLLGISCSFAASNHSEDLEPVVVTANRLAQTADDSLVPVTVISRQEIEQSQAQSVEDLLRGQAGIDISNNGGQGKATSVFLRGTNSDHVLVLVDGVKIGSATTGTAAFQDIPLALVDHIEIVRGPRSSLYGSEAIGGVIQIFTRKGASALTPALMLGGGSHRTKQGAATLAGGFATGGWFSVGLSGFDTDGFNACQGSTSAGCYTVEPDNDGYRNTSGRLRVGWRFDNGMQAEVNALHATGHNRYDGTSSNESNTVQDVFGTRLKFEVVPGWHADLRAGQSLDNADNLLNGVFKSRYDTRRKTVSWQNDIEINKSQLLVAGVDWLNDHVDSTTSYTETSRNNTGVFAQYLTELGAHRLQFSLREDHNQQFGSTTTGGAAWGYNLVPHLRLTASYATAFKAPSFNQLYYPGFGNANLQPECSRSIDLGLAGKFAKSRWSINAYETRVTDLIGYDATYTPVNINTARIRGIEVVASMRILQWDINTNLSLLDPVNEAQGANNGKLLPRRAQRLLSLSMDRDLGAWHTGVTLRGEGRRYDDLANTKTLGGYATLDLRAEYRFAKSLRLQGRIANVFDKQYETAYLYNQAGREFFVTLRYQP